MIINVSTLYNVKISCSLPVLMMQYSTLSLKDIAVITRKQPFAHHYDGAWLILIGSLWVRILAGGNHRMKAAPLPPPLVVRSFITVVWPETPSFHNDVVVSSTRGFRGYWIRICEGNSYGRLTPSCVQSIAVPYTQKSAQRWNETRKRGKQGTATLRMFHFALKHVLPLTFCAKQTRH